MTACAASRGAYRRGVHAELARDFDTAMAEYRMALERDPENIDYRVKYEQARYNAAFAHFQNGRRAFEKNDLDTARKEFTRTLEIDPSHDLAAQELERIKQIVQSRERKLPEIPADFDELKQSLRTDPRFQSQMEPKINAPITFHMAQDSRVLYESLANIAGFNVIFDPDFRGTRIQLDLTNVDIYEALDILSLQTRSFWQPINKTTFLVSQDNQTKRREYEQHIIKTIYLSNSVTSTEITEAITALRTILNMRYIAQSTSTNAIILRDTPDKIAIAEKILDDVDKSKPEVIVQALVLEVDRNQLRTLGINPPTSTAITYGTPTTTSTGTVVDNTVNLRALDTINTGNFSITIPAAVATAFATNGNARLLQSPSVRGTDGKQASIRIGSKIPVPSGSFQPAFVGATGTPVVQYQYSDIGVNLDITPRVLLNREVSLTVLVQVSALAGDRDAAGIKLPVFTNRSITHEIRLAEGETNILGGIITTTEATSISGFPGLKDIPILKYLFGQETKQRDTTEIVVMLTPHIVRMPDLSPQNLRGMYIGTEVNTRIRQFQPQSGAPAAPPAPTAPSTPPANLPPGVTIGTPPPPQLPATPVEPRPTNSTLTFIPSPATIPAGTPVPINIGITGTDIFAADLTIAYDPASLRLQEVRDGGFLSRDGQILAIVQKVESETGTARISIERPPGAPPLSGNGVLLTLMLQAAGRKGESVVRVIDFRLRDSQQNVSIGKTAEVRVNVP